MASAAQGGNRVAGIEFSIGSGGRISTPDWRSKALNTPALLIDEHRRVSPPNSRPERGRQSLYLRYVRAVAPEENKPKGVAALKKPLFIGGER
jgi:hypothetical protein